ncbi:MAG: substrate-binding domain-containing protein [Christensenellales bacterium]
MGKRSVLRIFCLMLVAILLFTVGCSNTKETSSGKTSYKIGVSLMNMNNPHFVIESEGIKAEAEKNGHSVVIIDPKYDSTKQVADIEDLISQGCDAIIIAPVDSKAIKTALLACQKANIPVVNVDVKVTDLDLVKAVVATDNYEAGKVLGEKMIKMCGGTAKIGLIERVVSEAVSARVKGFEDAIKAYPNMQIVARQDAKTTTEDALPVVENFLTSHPEITDIFCGNDLQMLGAVNACKANSRTDVRLYGVDGSENGMKSIQAGETVGTSAQFPQQIGATAVQLALKVLKGETIPEAEKLNLIPSKFVDKDNVGEYIKVYAK